jgi:hypothetical protein
MLTEPLIQQLHQLRLAGMAAALEQQQASPDSASRSFEDRFGIMIQHEFTERATHRVAMRLRWAKLPISACLDDIDTLRISRKEGQRFTACRSMDSRHVGPVLMKQDVLNFLSETNIRQ